MASSEDEGETVPKNVSDYVFLNGNDELIPLTVLPLEWKKGEIHDGKPLRIFVRGVTDNGHRKIYKQVTAWKFDLSYVKPEISVLSVEGHWIKLLKPKRLFQHIFMTIQVTLHFLHFVRWNPQQSPKAMWNHLNMTLSMFDRRPCANDLADHLPLINEAVQRDEKLANSKILSTFLVEKPWERNTSEEGVKPSFIVDDANEKEDHEDDMVDEDGDNGSDEDDCYDAVCAICDNGGDLLLCDGKCMRSFHTTIQDDGAFYCESLGLPDEELQAIRDVPFLCENCKYKEHQCFACGKLGSSDESSPEVFCCVNGTCGFFFHPDCVAKLLHPGDAAAAEELKQRIASGEQFACPAHRCHVCREVEVKSAKYLQFAVCRRCPRAYHRKCLPREITSEEDMDMERGIVRAWEGLIPYRILIYCLDHEIDLDIYTPVRDHIRFPGLSREGEKKLPLESGERKNKPPLEPSTEKNLLRKRGVTPGDDAWTRISAKPPKGFDRVSSSLVPGHIPKNQVKNFPLHVSSKKQKVATNGNSLGKTNAGEIPIGEKLYATFFGMDSGHAKSSCAGVVHGENEMSQKANSTTKRIDSSLTLDADSRKRILRLMEDASSSVTLDKVKNKLKAPSTHVQSKFSVTLGKAEASVQALRAALKKLDGGCCLEDAKAVCGEDLLPQVLRWKEKLKVYLAPFLYGTRYTSFGRHFTKTDKLREIVDILHWYVQDGDMLVDFCCGSNDFSCLMREKLDQMGKSCSFRNYDILQAKHEFNFERRDWMRVQPNELPDGSQLIMGLNPPFGVNAALANKFINKALTFKPKLLILIVPRETHRLDVKESPYDLIWEDNQMFVGKSFYLPGSVDVNDEQIEDWNVNAPGIYLWSRSNWTPKHRAIAEQHGHLKNFRLDESCHEMHSPISAQECLNLDKIFAKQGDDLDVDKHKNLRQQKDKVTKPTSHQNLNGISMPHHLAPIMADQPEIDMPRHVENRAPGNSRGNQFNGGYQTHPQTGYNGDEKMNDLVRRYSLNNEESHYGMISSRQAYAPIRPPDYGFNASANQFVVPFEERANNFGQPAFYPPPMPTSAMQQYAPPMMGNMVSGDMSPVYHPRGPQPAFHGPLGFAPGPHPSYFQQTSSGWLNE